MTEDLLTLAELSERAGVEIRTLRSWMAQNVIPGAETVGRNARYPRSALTRALAARAMREIYGMSLPEIRQDLLTADAARIEAYAAKTQAGALEAPPDDLPKVESRAPAAPSGGSAADYLRGLRDAGLFAAATPPPQTPAPPAQASRLARLAEALERIAGARPSRRKARGDVRVHIPITPDLELAVRGGQTPEEIARFEQIADLLRAILTGGADHD